MSLLFGLLFSPQNSPGPFKSSPNGEILPNLVTLAVKQIMNLQLHIIWSKTFWPTDIWPTDIWSTDNWSTNIWPADI
jgi:hypothetical protein